MISFKSLNPYAHNDQLLWKWEIAIYTSGIWSTWSTPGYWGFPWFSFKLSGTKPTSLPGLSWEDQPLPRAGLVVVPFLAMAVGLLAGLLGLGGGAAKAPAVGQDPKTTTLLRWTKGVWFESGAQFPTLNDLYKWSKWNHWFYPWLSMNSPSLPGEFMVPLLLEQLG